MKYLSICALCSALLFSACGSSDDSSKKTGIETATPYNPIDSMKKIPYKAIMGRMRVEVDDFKDSKFITPVGAPKYYNINFIYPYLATNKDGSGRTERLKFQYADDDWLFIENLQLMIDGQVKEIPMAGMEHEVVPDGGGIAEYLDVPCPEGPDNFINALARAKTVKIRWNGKQHYKERAMYPSELQGFRDIALLNKYLAYQEDTTSKHTAP